MAQFTRGSPLRLDLEAKPLESTTFIFLASQAAMLSPRAVAAFITSRITNTFSKWCLFPPFAHHPCCGWGACIRDVSLPRPCLKHCASQVHCGSAALSGAERAAAALSAAVRRICRRRRHFRGWHRAWKRGTGGRGAYAPCTTASPRGHRQHPARSFDDRVKEIEFKIRSEAEIVAEFDNLVLNDIFFYFFI